MRKLICISSSLLLLLLACKKQFKPQLTSISTNFLAVDGPILSGDSTIIRISRTTGVSDTTRIKAELKAIISIESDQNQLYTLTEKGKGLYVLGVTNFNTARKYRLNIKTADGKIYQSDFVPMKITPPIDSVYSKQQTDKSINYYVHTHDATNNTRYYRWDYKETWSYTSLYQSFYQYKNGKITFIAPYGPDDIFGCFRTANSNQVFVGSSAKLGQDIISNQLIGGIAAGSEKISRVYVMQLRQYALTEDGFKYYQALKSNTENLGSIFDPLPSFIKGNIHCVSAPNESVLGFISASTVTTKQINTRGSDLPLRVKDIYGEIPWAPYHYYAAYYFPLPDTTTCKAKSFFSSPFTSFPSRVTQFLSTGSDLLIDRSSAAPGDSYPTPLMPDAEYGVGYKFYYAPKNCVDCRLKGGTNVRPPYFPLPSY